MKRTIAENAQSSGGKKSSISLVEIILIAAYFLAVWLIPVGWLDTAIGAIAFESASRVNPYLSEYSIAFAQDPQYFIHCHLLATWMLAPIIMGVVIIRNGGFRRYEAFFERSVAQQSLAVKWVLYLFLLSMLYGMLWLVDYPLVRAERGVWVNTFGVAFYAFASASLLSVLGYGGFFLLKATFVQIFKGGPA